jgi:hypothetical protein
LRFWQACVEMEPDPYGRRQRRMVRSRDRDECQRKLQVALAEEAAKVRRPVQPVLPPVIALLASGSTGEWVRYWFEAIAKPDLAPKTAATYRSMIQLHIVPVLGDVPLIELSAAHVRSLSAAIRVKGLSGATALQAHRVLSASLSQAHREGYVHRNVALLTKTPKNEANRLATLTVDDARRIIDCTKAERLGSRWAAAILTGARQGELLGLELDRVDDTLDLSWQLQRLTWAHGCTPFCGWRRGTECPDRFIDAPVDHERRELTGGLWLTRPKSAAGWRTIPLVEPLRAMVEARIGAPLDTRCRCTKSRHPRSPDRPADGQRCLAPHARRGRRPAGAVARCRHAAIDLLY